MRTYHGKIIRECAWAGNPHDGRWLVQTYHESGTTPWADEHCLHYWTLAQAKEAIREDAPEDDNKFADADMIIEQA